MEAAIRSSESIVEAVLTRTRFWIRHLRAEVNERQLKALGRMLDTLPHDFVGGMTNKKYAHLTAASPATAQRDLADLVAKGYLVLRGAGRSARYELANA
jgi:Fic family protein